MKAEKLLRENFKNGIRYPATVKEIADFAEQYHANETKQEQSEKDALIKILYDLRKDVNELKGKNEDLLNSISKLSIG